MTFRMEHSGIYVADLKRAIDFYVEALGIQPMRTKSADDREIVFMGNDLAPHQLEIVHLLDRSQPYDLGENKAHLAFRTDDFEAAREKHRQMGCLKEEMPAFGIYFIQDPDGYVSEIMPVRK